MTPSPNVPPCVRNRGGASARMAKFVTALLRPGRENGGWIKVDALARECGIARATAYRYLDALESAGWPLERDSDSCSSTQLVLGVRSLLVGQRLPVDTNAASRRTL